MAVGWALEPWKGPSPTATQAPSFSIIRSDFLPGFESFEYSPGALRWSLRYLARLAAEGWRMEITPRIRNRAKGFCERCNHRAEILEVHHRHYETLGCESDDDLEALCPVCHDSADAERREYAEALAAERLEEARFDGYCKKILGPIPVALCPVEQVEYLRNRFGVMLDKMSEPWGWMQ